MSETPDGLVLLQSAGVYTQLDVATIVGSLELFRDKLYFMSFFIFMLCIIKNCGYTFPVKSEVCG